jgi:hypothetical protein
MGIPYVIDRGLIDTTEDASVSQPSTLTRVIFGHHFSVDFHRDLDQNRHFSAHFRRFYTDFDRF